MDSPHPAIRKVLATRAAALKDLAQKIHRHPELGLEERKACAWQAALLKQWGFAVQTPFAGQATAYKAVFGRGRPIFCVMAEYDALPGIGHACGHNLIAAAALGAGHALAEVARRQKLPGTVVVMGTPAEEGLGGKVRMIARNALKGIDAVMMAHPSFRTVIDTGCSAVKRFAVRFQGVSAHAATAPEKARNALDAVLLTFQGVNAWRQHLPETSRVHGIIDHGGTVPNVIPDRASCVFYLRALTGATLEEMTCRFRDIVEGAAQMTGTAAAIAPGEMAYKARMPNAPLNEAYTAAARQAGLNPVVPERTGRGSSDFGDVSVEVPAAHVYFQISRKEIACHSAMFRQAAGSAFGLRQMFRAAEALAVCGHRYLSDAAFRERVRADFQDNPRRN